MDDFDDAPRLLTAGVAAAPLIADPKSWINRRVETVDILAKEQTRRRVSIDFTLSGDVLEALRIDDGVVVPISALTKEARRQFDLRDEGGRALPVLGRFQNGELTHIALMSSAADVLPANLPEDQFEELATDLRAIVFGSPTEAADRLALLIDQADHGDEMRAAVWNDPACRSLLRTAWSSYVLFAVIGDGSPNRRILKYSYGDDFDLDLKFEDDDWRSRLHPREIWQRISAPDRRQFLIESPGAWRAASFHTEIAIPEELRVDEAFTFDQDSWQVLGMPDYNVNRASLYASDGIDEGQDARTFVSVVPERAGHPLQAAVTGMVVATLLWLGAISGLDATNPAPAVSLLLAGAAFFSGVSANQGEHRLVKTIFKSSRLWLGLVALSALAGSVSLAMGLPCAQPVDVWKVAAIVCSIAAARLAWSAIRAAS